MSDVPTPDQDDEQGAPPVDVDVDGADTIPAEDDTEAN